jgi:hypothetical protein
METGWLNVLGPVTSIASADPENDPESGFTVPRLKLTFTELLEESAPAGKVTLAPSIGVPLPLTVMVPPLGLTVCVATTVLVPETNEVPPLPLTALNVAVTLLFASIVTEHDPDPLQAPDQPANVEPLFAVAVNDTTVPLV